MEDLAAPRWDGRAPWVETWYALTRPADASWALWLRYQVLLRMGHPMRASVWGAFFHSDPILRRSDADGAPAPPGDALFRSPHGELHRHQAEGALPGMRWNLGWSHPREAYSVLPFAWMRRAAFPRMKVATPVPAARATGSFEVGGRTFDAAGATLMLGHTWGSAHAHRWAWLHAPLPDGVFEAVAAVPFGGSPRLTAARIEWGGRAYRLASARTLLAARSEWTPVSWRFAAAGQGARVEAEARADLPDSVALEYRDPGGGARVCHAGDRAELSLTLHEPEGRAVRLQLPASLEVGLPTVDAAMASRLSPYEPR